MASVTVRRMPICNIMGRDGYAAKAMNPRRLCIAFQRRPCGKACEACEAGDGGALPRRLEAGQDRLAPGKTHLFDLETDSGEKSNVAGEHPELEARLLAQAKEKKPSLWIKAQPAFLGAQGKTIFDPDFDIDDGGLPHEKPVLPAH